MTDEVSVINAPEAFFAPNSMLYNNQGTSKVARQAFYGSSEGEVEAAGFVVANSYIDNTFVEKVYNGGSCLMRTIRLENGEEITGTDELRLLTVIPLEEEGQYDMLLKELQDIVPDEDYIVYNPQKSDEGVLTFTAIKSTANLPRGIDTGYAIVHENPSDNSFILNKMIVNIPV